MTKLPRTSSISTFSAYSLLAEVGVTEVMIPFSKRISTFDRLVDSPSKRVAFLRTMGAFCPFSACHRRFSRLW